MPSAAPSRRITVGTSGAAAITPSEVIAELTPISTGPTPRCSSVRAINGTMPPIATPIDSELAKCAARPQPTRPGGVATRASAVMAGRSWIVALLGGDLHEAVGAGAKLEAMLRAALDDRGVERQRAGDLAALAVDAGDHHRSEEHTSELQSLMRT